MQSFRNMTGIVVVMLVMTNILQVMAHEEQVIVVGRNSAGQIVVDSDFEQPVELPASVFPGISGYATGEMGVHSTVSDDPANDFFQFSPTADFRFILLAKDPGIEVWNDNGSGFMATNESFFIGVSPFDTHPIWNIVNGTPGNTYSLTLKIHDTNSVYLDSEPFVLSFTPISPPYSLHIVRTDPIHAELLWPTNAVGWKLESASFLNAITWAEVTNVPGVTGTNFSLVISTTETQQFFRIQKHSH